MDIPIVFSDKHYVVINKPAGVLTHASTCGETLTVTAWIREHFPETVTVGDNPRQRPGIVHRLDKDTSGLLVIARTQRAFEHLKRQFAGGEISKMYAAVVCGTMRQRKGTIDKPIGLKAGTTKRTVHGGKMVKTAVTEFVVRKTFQRAGKTFSLLDIHPLTGRTHQIRVHLNAVDHPVAGDTLYGGKNAAGSAPRLMLHARSIEFSDVSGKRIRVEASPPRDFLDFVGAS